MDTGTKIFVGVSILALIALAFLSFFGKTNLDNRATDCKQKNGVMVKTIEGWRCLETRII